LNKGHALHNSICSFTKFNLQLRKSPDNPEALQQVKIIIFYYNNKLECFKGIPPLTKKNRYPQVKKNLIITMIFDV